MTQKITKQPPAPNQRNAANAETNRPQPTTAQPSAADGQPLRNPTPSGTDHALCKDRKTMTQKITKQPPAPNQRNAANAETDGPQPTTAQPSADGGQPLRNPTLSGTDQPPCLG